MSKNGETFQKIREEIIFCANRTIVVGDEMQPLFNDIINILNSNNYRMNISILKLNSGCIIQINKVENG